VDAQTAQATGAARRENATAQKIEAFGPIADLIEDFSTDVIGGMSGGWDKTVKLPGKLLNLVKSGLSAAGTARSVYAERRRVLEELERKAEIEREEKQRKRKKGKGRSKELVIEINKSSKDYR